MSQRPSILFACRDNAGISLLAEAIVNHAHREIRAFSAGAHASGSVDAVAVECLADAGVPIDGLSSKPLELFGFSGAPRIDLVVCLAGDVRERIERFAGMLRLPMEAWTLDDPSALSDERRRRHAYRTLIPRLRTGISALAAARTEPAFVAA